MQNTYIGIAGQLFRARPGRIVGLSGGVSLVFRPGQTCSEYGHRGQSTNAVDYTLRNLDHFQNVYTDAC